MYHSLSVEEPLMPSTTSKDLQRTTKLYQKKWIISLNVMVHRLEAVQSAICQLGEPLSLREEGLLSLLKEEEHSFRSLNESCVEQFRSFKEGMVILVFVN